MLPDTTESGRPPVSRALRIALIVSLAVNLLFIAAMGTLALKGPPRPPHGADLVRDMGFGAFTGALDEDDRRALRDGFRARGPDLRQARARMRDELDDVLRALRAQPYDPRALEAAFQQQQARLLERMALGQALLSDRFNAMTEAERLAFADRLEKSLTRKGGKP